MRILSFFLRYLSFFLGILLLLVGRLQAKLEVGIDALQAQKFSIIKNKKVALLTNTSAVNAKGEFVLDVFVDSKNVQLKVVLLPEHNGNFDDKKLEELKKKGISVYCTHTPTSRSPLPEWLKDVDVVVADMQDIGMRYYTHSSSILYAMTGAFKAGKEFVLLDRPNPLGGNYIGGPPMDEKYLCFLGPIPGEPLFHGMTTGELMNYVKNCKKDIEVKCNCGMNGCAHGVFCDKKTLKKGKLTIVKVKGWNRKKTLTEAGPYSMDSPIAMSPAIQNAASIFEYALLSFATLAGKDFVKFLELKENSQFNLQLGQRKFKYLFFPHSSLSLLLNKISKEYAFALKGCQLVATEIDANDADNNLKQKIDCLELSITNFSSSDPAILSLVLLAEAQEWIPECDWEAFEKTPIAETSSPHSSETTVSTATPTIPIRDLKKLTLAQQKSLRKAKWDRLTKLQRELIQKHIGDDEFANKLLDGELIDVTHFRNKWTREATSFYNKTKQYYLY